MKRKVLIFATAAIALVAALGFSAGRASAQAAPPVANPGGPYAGVVGQLIQVSGAASTGFNLTFLWNWGDGTSSPGPVAAHAYGAANTYTITLTVTDGLGRSSSATTAAVVTGGTAGFTNGFFPGFFGFGFNTFNQLFGSGCFNTLVGLVCGNGFGGVSPFFGAGCTTFNGFCTFGQFAGTIVSGGVVGSQVYVPGVGYFICTTVNFTPSTCSPVVR